MQSAGHVAEAADTEVEGRVLFVDDEDLILRSIRRLLQTSGKRRHSAFVNSGVAALEELARARYDVVVVDLSLADMPGASLLESIQAEYPDVVRVVLSGYIDAGVSLSAIPFAHQFLAKPFDPADLWLVLDRAIALRRLLTNPSIRALVGGRNELPAAPSTYLRLTSHIDSDEASIRGAARIIERDVGISARLIQLARSALFGLPEGATTLPSIVAYLGLDTIKTLLLYVEIVRSFRPPRYLEGFAMSELERHGFSTGHIARAIVGSGPMADIVFLAGLLHRVGQLVLAARAPKRLAEVLDHAHRLDRPLVDVERELLGVSQAAIGAYLLGVWGLPEPLVSAVLAQGEPADRAATTIVSEAVRVAAQLARDPDGPVEAGSGLLGSDAIQAGRSAARALHGQTGTQARNATV